MRLEHSFEVPVPVDQAWRVLLDIERVAPCMPGATLTSHEGDDFTGTVKVKLGPVNLTYKGKGRFVEIDEAAHRVQVTASGADSRGAGTAAAKVTAVLVEAGSATRVEVVTDLDITGKAAQFGRGLIGDVSAKLVGQFADCLAGQFTASAEPSASELVPSEAAPVAAVSGDRAVSGDGAAAVSAPAPAFKAPEEAEPVDLLAITGVGPAVKRALPYVVTAVASFLVVLGVIWWVKRR